MDVQSNDTSVSERERAYLKECLANGRISGNGPFTDRCHDVLATRYGAPVLLVHSASAAFEAAAILVDLKPGDEVLMPSFASISVASAIVLRGAVPVFIDIRPDTLNIDETKIAAAMTSKTRAIVAGHYAGVAAAMSDIVKIASENGIVVLEDVTQGYGATLDGKPLGTFGEVGCLGFRQTQNGVCGALIINEPALVERAVFIRECGTNRTRFLRREVSKYEWVDIGSSFLPSDLLAAVLLAQIEHTEDASKRRTALWARYQSAFKPLEDSSLFRLPAVPRGAGHNAQLYWIVAARRDLQKEMIAVLKAEGIAACSHHEPVHASPAALRYTRTVAPLPVTEHAASCLFRLPLDAMMSDADIASTIEKTLFHAKRLIAANDACQPADRHNL